MEKIVKCLILYFVLGREKRNLFLTSLLVNIQVTFSLVKVPGNNNDETFFCQLNF